MIGANLFDQTIDKASAISKVNFYKSGLLAVLGLVISGLLIYWITYNIENLSGNSGIRSFVLNILLVTLILGLIYKTLHIKLPAGNAKKMLFSFNNQYTLIYTLYF